MGQLGLDPRFFLWLATAFTALGYLETLKAEACFERLV